MVNSASSRKIAGVLRQPIPTACTRGAVRFSDDLLFPTLGKRCPRDDFRCLSLTDTQRDRMQAHVPAQRKRLTCPCPVLTAANPVLANSTGHVVIHTQEQWTAVVGREAADLIGSNARNNILREVNDVHEILGEVERKLQDLHIPCHDFTMGHTSKRGLFSGSTPKDVIRETSQPISTHIAHSLQCTLWLSSTLAAETPSTCRTLKIFTTFGTNSLTGWGGFVLP